VRREKFLARLSDSKQDCVKRLELLPVEFWDSLDDLIPFAGLWPAIMIGTFPRLLNLHCPEVLAFIPHLSPVLIRAGNDALLAPSESDDDLFYR
jgi:hypothetical protein